MPFWRRSIPQTSLQQTDRLRFMSLRLLLTLIPACDCLVAVAAQAQSTGADIVVEAVSDRRERGLSWSDGKPAFIVSATIPATFNWSLDIEASTLRGSERHGGADVGLAFAPRYAVTSRGWTFAAGGRGNVFIEASGMSFVEVTGEVGRTIGPARLTGSVDFAPSQAAIGGSNVRVGLDAEVGISGMPLTVYGGVGHSSGSTRDALRARRLRPGGQYVDYRIGIERIADRLALGLLYSGTNIDAREAGALSPYVDNHVGSTVLAYIRFSP